MCVLAVISVLRVIRIACFFTPCQGTVLGTVHGDRGSLPPEVPQAGSRSFSIGSRPDLGGGITEKGKWRPCGDKVLDSDLFAWDVVRSSFSSAAHFGTVPTVPYTSLTRAVLLLLVCWDFLLPRKASWSLRSCPQLFSVLCGLRALKLWSFAEAVPGECFLPHQCPADGPRPLQNRLPCPYRLSGHALPEPGAVP